VSSLSNHHSQHRIDGAMLADEELGDQDLQELGITLRLHRRRILSLVSDSRHTGVRCPWRDEANATGEGNLHAPEERETGGAQTPRQAAAADTAVGSSIPTATSGKPASSPVRGPALPAAPALSSDDSGDEDEFPDDFEEG
jgi:hypothetical protein